MPYSPEQPTWKSESKTSSLSLFFVEINHIDIFLAIVILA